MKRRVPLSRIWSLSLSATALVLLAAAWYAGSDPGVAAQAQALADGNSLAAQLQTVARSVARDFANGLSGEKAIAELEFGADRALLKPKPLPYGQELQDQIEGATGQGPTPAASWLSEAKRLCFEQDWLAAEEAVAHGEREIHEGERATWAKLMLSKAEVAQELGRAEEAAAILEAVRTSTFPSDLLDGPLHLKLGFRIAEAWMAAGRQDRAQTALRQTYGDLIEGRMAMSPQRLSYYAADLQNRLDLRADAAKLEQAVEDYFLADEVRDQIRKQPEASSLIIRGRVLFFNEERTKAMLYHLQPAIRIARARLEASLPASEAFQLVSGGSAANGAVVANLEMPQGFSHSWRLVLAKPEAYKRPAVLRQVWLWSGTLLILLALAIVGVWGARALRRRAELERLRRDFIAGVSHELRTPAASISLLAGNLIDGRVTSEDRRREYYKAINRDAQRLQRLVADVLDASRLERGVFQIDPRPVMPAPLLQELAAEQAPRLADAGLELRAEVDDNLPEAQMDDAAVERAVANLLENARKYATDGELVILRGFCQGGDVVIEVEDRGPGVPDDLRDKIFEAYERGLAGRGPNGEAGENDNSIGLAAGAGLGLALVRETLQAHGGSAVVLDPKAEVVGGGGSDAILAAGEQGLTTGARFQLRFPVSLT
jgi:signal transduction histidine kinase